MTKLTYDAAPTHLELAPLEACYDNDISHPNAGVAHRRYDPTRSALNINTPQKKLPEAPMTVSNKIKSTLSDDIFICVAWTTLGVFLISLIFDPLNIGIISTVIFGIFALVGLYVYAALITEMDDITKETLLWLGGGPTIFLLIMASLYLLLSPPSFALVLTWMLLVPIILIALHLFLAVADTPIGDITPSDGFWGYIGMHVFVVTGIMLLLLSLDGGGIAQLILAKLFYFFDWNWLAHLLDPTRQWDNAVNAVHINEFLLQKGISAADITLVREYTIDKFSLLFASKADLQGCVDGIQINCDQFIDVVKKVKSQ